MKYELNSQTSYCCIQTGSSRLITLRNSYVDYFHSQPLYLVYLVKEGYKF